MRMNPIPKLLCIAVLGTFLALGCAGSESTERESLSWHLQEVGRFGTVEGEGSALSEVAGIALTDSTVLVLESSPPRVAVFSHDGVWVRDLGRSGDGPGEFQNPLELGLHEGNIWVGDPNGVRVEAFAPDGSPVSSFRFDIPRDSLNDVAVPTAILADGSVLAAPRRIISASTRNRPYYRTSRTGEVLDLLYRQPVVEGDMLVAALAGGGLAVGLHPLPLTPLVDLLPGGDGLVVVDRPEAVDAAAASFTIKVIGLNGEATEFNIPYTPVSADGWLDDFAQRMEEEEVQQSGSVNRERITAIRGGLDPRSFYPPVSAVVAGTDGSIWVRREDFIVADSVQWQVFDTAGEQVGTLSAPKNLNLVLPSLEEVWAVEPGEFDVPFVVRFQVQS